MNEKSESFIVDQMELVVSKDCNYLVASPDGRVTLESGEVGLLEIKNLVHNKPIDLNEAAKSMPYFCLKDSGHELKLKRGHNYYYQVQGKMGVCEMPWVDFVVRTVNPYQLHIERVYFDGDLWEKIMFPKLKAFMFKPYFLSLLLQLIIPWMELENLVDGYVK